MNKIKYNCIVTIIMCNNDKIKVGTLCIIFIYTSRLVDGGGAGVEARTYIFVRENPLRL